VPNSTNAWPHFAQVFPKWREVVPEDRRLCEAQKASRGILTMPAGETMVVQRYWLVRAAFGKNLLHLGPEGVRSIGKLVNNLLSLGGNKL
jgi:hypothetical protein